MTEILKEAEAIRAESFGRGVPLSLEHALLILVVQALRERKKK